MCWLSIVALKIGALFHKLASHNETWSIVDNKELTVSIHCAGEPVADVARDRRRRGVGGRGLLRNWPKPCVYHDAMKDFLFCFLFFKPCACLHVFSLSSDSLPFPYLSCLYTVYIFFNHCYNSVCLDIIRQIKPASPPSTYLCFYWLF